MEFGACLLKVDHILGLWNVHLCNDPQRGFELFLY